jgi:hypothetical protein
LQINGARRGNSRPIRTMVLIMKQLKEMATLLPGPPNGMLWRVLYLWLDDCNKLNTLNILVIMVY